MKLQLSSGQGPAECELAVGKFWRALKKEFPEIRTLRKMPGKKVDCYTCIQLECEEDLSFLEGSIKWICKSPYRPAHKRKNWFIDVSICREAELVEFNQDLVRFQTFHSSGKGGQHVNKVETGVRAVYLPTGMSVVSTDGRSQHMNKQIALNQLCEIIARENLGSEETVKSLNRLEHFRLERGNPVRAYEGMEFKQNE